MPHSLVRYCLRSASRCLSDLGIGSQAGATILPRSLSRTSVYVGIAVVFGILRLPQVVFEIMVTRIELIHDKDDKDYSVDQTHTFWCVWIASYAFYPLVGVANAVWFSRRFQLVKLWRNRWRNVLRKIPPFSNNPNRQMLQQPLEDPIIETVIGLF